VWDAGSRFVLCDTRLRQINLATAARNTTRHFRWGPAARPLDDASFRYASATFQGVGLRPYPVAHLQAQRAGTTVTAQWIRQTRTDGDNWDGIDVPLGEDDERYLVRRSLAGAILGEDITTAATWSGVLPASGALTVAQISARYGAGAVQTIVVP